MYVAIAGASGYTGAELLRILSRYKDIEINQITSRQYTGKTLKDVFPVFTKSKYENLTFKENLDLSISDIYFLCLPHEASLELVKQLYDNGKIIIDLSAAYRIKKSEIYKEFYGFEHNYPQLLEEAVYGLPEIYRDKIKTAKIVANPGCYPTATLLGLYPLIKNNLLNQNNSVIVNALSGISGAGRHLKEDFMYPESYSNVYAYNITKHRHTPEMEDVIENVSKKKISIRFTPHIIPISRGMLSTINVFIEISKKDLKELYYDTYKNEYFIRLQDRPSRVKEVIGTNFCDIYVDYDEKNKIAVITSAIDNLSKGASSQAVQNLNIILNKPENYCLENLPLFP
ncbi:N-acetyl-gamma-glutamyl-phosphate reductase [Sulfurihydrogenibium azorense]|uniref:N-acetyl-gamma-glutamyl-phosphate reductase n=1 Tax=Sulfurihydrogenibium azorense TaxID=309806 RepID=UPI00391BAE9D